MNTLVLLALALRFLAAHGVWGANPQPQVRTRQLWVRNRSLGSHLGSQDARSAVRSLRNKMEMARLQIEMMPVDRVVPCIRKARPRVANLPDQIATSISQLSFTNPSRIGGGTRTIADQTCSAAATLFGLNGKAPHVRDGAPDHITAERAGDDAFPGRTKGRSAGWACNRLPETICSGAPEGRSQVAITALADVLASAAGSLSTNWPRRAR